MKDALLVIIGIALLTISLIKKKENQRDRKEIIRILVCIVVFLGVFAVINM